MSTILDALKKSERERTLVRGVGFGDAGRRTIQQSSRLPWVIASIVLVLLVVGTVMIARYYRGPDPTAAKVGALEPKPALLTPVAAESSAPNTSILPAGNAQLLSAMPQEFQSSLPPMTVSIHVYTPDESQRILYINNRQYRRGDDVGGGVYVEQIVADGVVLQFRGKRFKLARPS